MADTQLQVVDPAKVKKELGLADPKSLTITPGNEKDLDAKADGFVTQLMAVDPETATAPEAIKASVETMASDVQKQAAKMSEMLKQPLASFSRKGAEGGDVASALVNLKVEVEKIDPGKLDLEPGWFTRAIGRIP